MLAAELEDRIDVYHDWIIWLRPTNCGIFIAARNDTWKCADSIEALKQAIRAGNIPPGHAPCARCGGLGTVTHGAGRVKCPQCEGTGFVPIG